MADPEVSVDTDAMTNAASSILDLTGQFQGIYSRLSARLGEAGKAWGDDATGQAFEANYNQPKTSVLNGLSGSAQALDSTYQGVTTMAKGFADTEAENKASIHLGAGAGGDSGLSDHSEG
jgi:uncharacterized protein YukE